MTSRHGLERQNEYFIPGDGISREVIQADICRYLGNDALVRPGNHNGRQGYFIRAYRNLTSEMISDLKADSARWEADVRSRADQGYPRGNYIQDYSYSQPNRATPTYAPMHAEVPQGQGPSPPTTLSAPLPQYAEQYPATTSAQYSNAPSYPPNHSGFGTGQNPYPPQHVSYTAPNQPPVTTEGHPSYTYAPSNYGFDNGRNNAPRYAGPGYDPESDYATVTTGMAYPTTAAPDPRIPMEPRYTPESAYSDRSRPQPTREREAPRRTR
ncbi:putative transcription factor RfeG [Aspergillus lucknowensis]|uniref:Transcription factor RfeG n=1 Tax=Aspergillus lucknowensis TaxID=176173 RepID=A0ABR4LYT3_9EURO